MGTAFYLNKFNVYSPRPKLAEKTSLLFKNGGELQVQYIQLINDWPIPKAKTSNLLTNVLFNAFTGTQTLLSSSKNRYNLKLISCSIPSGWKQLFTPTFVLAPNKSSKQIAFHNTGNNTYTLSGCDISGKYIIDSSGWRKIDHTSILILEYEVEVPEQTDIALGLPWGTFVNDPNGSFMWRSLLQHKAGPANILFGSIAQKTNKQNVIVNNPILIAGLSKNRWRLWTIAKILPGEEIIPVIKCSFSPKKAEYIFKFNHLQYLEIPE